MGNISAEHSLLFYLFNICIVSLLHHQFILLVLGFQKPQLHASLGKKKNTMIWISQKLQHDDTQVSGSDFDLQPKSLSKERPLGCWETSDESRESGVKQSDEMSRGSFSKEKCSWRIIKHLFRGPKKRRKLFFSNCLFNTERKVNFCQRQKMLQSKKRTLL